MLQNGELLYYKDDELRGAVVVRGASSVDTAPPEAGSRQHAFAVRHPSRTFLATAESADELTSAFLGALGSRPLRGVPGVAGATLETSMGNARLPTVARRLSSCTASDSAAEVQFDSLSQVSPSMRAGRVSDDRSSPQSS